MLTTFYPPYSFGGDAIGIQRLATAMARDGHQITILHDIDAYRTLSDHQPAPIEHPENIEVIGLESRFGLLSNLLTHQLGHPIVHRQQLKDILTSGSFDIIWYHNISLIGGPGLLSYGDALKIYEAHEHWLVCPTHVLWRFNRELCTHRECLRCTISYHRPPQWWRHTALLDNKLGEVDAFIAKSEFSRDKHSEFGFSRPMQVVPYFLPESSPPVQEKQQSPHDRPYFLFVGRLEKIKGLDDVIPIFANYPDADLLILGNGDYEETLKQQAGNITNVKFLGRLAPEELSRYYSGAMALIVPSVCYETFGIILIESFRQGTPVIAKALGPFVEIVEKSGGGLLYSNSEELTAAMRRLQTDTQYREQLADRALLSFKEYWCESAVMSQYYEVIRKAAEHAGKQKIVASLQ